MMKKINLSNLEIREKELRAKIVEEEEKLEKLSNERKKIEARAMYDNEMKEAYKRYHQVVDVTLQFSPNHLKNLHLAVTIC